MLARSTDLHIVATDGCFDSNGNFITGPEPDPKELEDAFRWEVLKLLKDAGKINDLVIENMMVGITAASTYIAELLSTPLIKKGWRD